MCVWFQTLGYIKESDYSSWTAGTRKPVYLYDRVWGRDETQSWVDMVSIKAIERVGGIVDTLLASAVMSVLKDELS